MLFLFLSLNMVPWNSASGGFAYNWQSKWVGIIAIKTERTQIHFLSDVLVAVASLNLKVPNRDQRMRQVVAYKRLKTMEYLLLEVPTVTLWLVKFWCLDWPLLMGGRNFREVVADAWSSTVIRTKTKSRAPSKTVKNYCRFDEKQTPPKNDIPCYNSRYNGHR